jgi:hypothetical protein
VPCSTLPFLELDAFLDGDSSGSHDSNVGNEVVVVIVDGVEDLQRMQRVRKNQITSQTCVQR